MYLQGVVDWFDEPKGYGFVKSDAGETYYMHRSEVLEGRLPIGGRRVSFYVQSVSWDSSGDKNRACHITVESQT